MTPVELFHWNPEIDIELITGLGLRFLQESDTGRLMSIGAEPTYERVRATIVALAQATTSTVIKACTYRNGCIGFAALLLVEQPFTGARYVDETGIWVSPEHRGNTLAAPLLIAASENWARQVGAPVLKMTAPPRTGFGRYLRRRGYESAEEVLIKRL